LGVPDIRKTLPVLKQQWEQCRACELGQRRASTGGAFVFGEGLPGRIMLIGEGPGKDEEKEGRPFVGKSGQILRDVLTALSMNDIVYITNIVACRSCAHAYDNEGHPKYWDDGRPAIVDQPPSPLHIQACSDRLYEEIYLVDPVLIVTLGGTAAEKLLGHPITVTTACGTTHTAAIPGAGQVATFTEKRKQWRRKVRGEWVQPTMQNVVNYHCFVNLHPAYVARYLEDRRPGAPVELFYRTMQRARDVYNKYMQETYSI
jgi:uracil-DNA glycosylase